MERARGLNIYYCMRLHLRDELSYRIQRNHATYSLLSYTDVAVGELCTLKKLLRAFGTMGVLLKESDVFYCSTDSLHLNRLLVLLTSDTFAHLFKLRIVNIVDATSFDGLMMSRLCR